MVSLHIPYSQSASSPLSIDERIARTRQIAKELWRFDLPSLIWLLDYWGWAASEIRFASHVATHSPGALLHELEVSPAGPLVKVVVNAGLLGPQSPLPSYFFRQFEAIGTQHAEMMSFFEFWDHITLTRWIAAAVPEIDLSAFGDFELYRRRELETLNLRAPATLLWLFQTAVPELPVVIEKTTLLKGVESSGVQLGVTTLGGDALLGRRAQVPVKATRLVFTTDEERAASGKPWPAEISARLQSQVFPLLAAAGAHIEVLLEVRAAQSWAKVGAQSYLGYDRMRGTSEQFRRIRIHSGEVG